MMMTTPLMATVTNLSNLYYCEYELNRVATTLDKVLSIFLPLVIRYFTENVYRGEYISDNESDIHEELAGMYLCCFFLNAIYGITAKLMFNF